MSTRRSTVALALLIALASIRMATTFRVFSATVDEATHVGAGLELIEFHRNLLQRLNPPLPRLVYAAAPWAGGMRFNADAPTIPDQLHSVFYDHGGYERNLFLARLGTLVFFIIAATALAAWTRRELGANAAVTATLLFTMEPIILGYSALATHDGPATAGVAVVLLAMSRWLEQRTTSRTAQLGAAFGFSVLCKFSCIVYAPLACAAIFAVRCARDRRVRSADALRVIAIVPLLAMLVVWAGYGFTFARVNELHGWPLPAPTFFAGFAGIVDIDNGGFLSYAFGQTSMRGWWWYFPAAITLKTTIAFLLLIAIGSYFALRDRELRWPALEGLAASAAILAIAMPSTLDIGVRYVLPMYVPLTFAAAACTIAMLRARQRIVRATAVALLVTQSLVSLIAHPDYFPFFNALAGREPSRYLADSNIDWGQDVLRLRDAVIELNIRHISTELMGPADLNALGFPAHDKADVAKPSRGWIAVSEQAIRMMSWSWLADRPYRKIGRSIRLYYIP
jgi:4-amino-4-deoxy-L-arabinose transferase-like glycosyltransferase